MGEDCGIIVNKNRLPYDKRSAAVASGIRLGTPIVTRNGMRTEQMDLISELLHAALHRVRVAGPTKYKMDKSLCERIRDKVSHLCEKFPVR